MTLDVVDILRQLIPIDSRNTCPLDKSGPRVADERAMVAFLTPLLRDLGFAVDVREVAPNRPNLVATRQAVAGAPYLAFEAHMDTVGTDGMTIDPFDPVLRDGRIYGRGACDTKGGMAAMLAALADLAACEAPVNLMFVAACAEETGCQGSPDIDLSAWDLDGVIVGEPTNNEPVIAHKANACFDLVCKGKAAHGARPESGTNAIYRAMDLVAFLRRDMIPELASHQHPAFDGSTLAVTLVQGGTKGNIIPDVCTLTCDLRLVPGYGSPEEAIAGIVQRAGDTLGFEVEPGWMHTTPGLDTASDHPLVKRVLLAMSRLGRNAHTGAVSYCTDGGVFAANGIPSLVLGPGDIRQAHGAVEFVSVEQLHEAVDIYRAVALACAP